MSSCCHTDKTTYPKKATCPANGNSYGLVSRKTLLHHLAKPWDKEIPEQAYYFCDSVDCDVVYFGEDDRVFTRNDLRTDVGQKSQQADRTLCYCFGVSQQDDEQNPAVKDFVIEQTRSGSCDCEIRNPAGRCCLKDFPKPPS